MAVRLSHALELDSLFRLASQIEPLLKNAPASSDAVEFDVSDILPLDTAFYVTAGNLARRFAACGIPSIRFLLPGRAVTLDEFHPELSALESGGEPVDDRYMSFPLTSFVSADSAIVQDFAGRFFQFLPNIPARLERFEASLGELMENVAVHSNCPWGGYLCGYLNRTDRLLRCAIADFGDGVPWTLNKLDPYSDKLGDDTVMYEASKYGITSKAGRAGSGIDYASSFAKALGGALRIYSRRGCLRMDAEATCLMFAPVEYPGTLITMDLPLN